MYTFLLGVMWYVAFLFSATLHEAAHAFAALKLGDRTAYDAGQVTIDPISHIKREPIGMVVVPIASFILNRFTWMFGWASCPYSVEWAQRYPRREAYMSLAGPFTNLLLVILCIFVVRIGISLDIFYRPTRITFTEIVGAASQGRVFGIATFVSIMFSLNLILFVFNLIPLPPLDGRGIFALILSEERAAQVMHILRQPGLRIIGLLVAWRFIHYVIIPVRLFFINYLLYPGAHFQ